MKINKRYNGSIIGTIFTLISLLLTFTIVMPMVSVMPVFLLKDLLGIHLSFLIMSLVMAASLIIIIIKSKQIELTNRHIILIMIIEYFILHSFGFLIYWWIDLDFKNDAQIALAIFPIYLISSFGLSVLGLFIDTVKRQHND